MFLAILKPMNSGSRSRRKGGLSTQSKKRSPGGEGMFIPSASAGQEGCLISHVRINLWTSQAR